MVNWLLDAGAGASVDEQCLQGLTPVHTAVEQRNFSILKLLLPASRMVDLPDNSGKTALHRSVGWPQGMRSLLEWGAKPNIQDEGDNLLSQCSS